MKTVLIADDEFAIVQTLAEILAWEGYAVVTAANGRAALAELRKQKVDVVLLDFMMPVMDGRQVLEQLRADPSLRDTPVIMMTAAPMAVGIHSWNALLRKPFDVAQLLRALASVFPASGQ
jgi:CheY-like chemotaxis protein